MLREDVRLYNLEFAHRGRVLISILFLNLLVGHRARLHTLV